MERQAHLLLKVLAQTLRLAPAHCGREHLQCGFFNVHCCMKRRRSQPCRHLLRSPAAAACRHPSLPCTPTLDCIAVQMAPVVVLGAGGRTGAECVAALEAAQQEVRWAGSEGREGLVGRAGGRSRAGWDGAGKRVGQG